MSDTSTELAIADGGQVSVAEQHGVNAYAHEGATPRQYVMIAVVLAIVTAVEIAISYLPESVPDWLRITLLFVCAIIKFALVISWFMHLRFDNKILRRLFYVGLVAAPLLYLIVLASLHVFDSNV